MMAVCVISATECNTLEFKDVGEIAISGAVLIDYDGTVLTFGNCSVTMSNLAFLALQFEETMIYGIDASDSVLQLSEIHLQGRGHHWGRQRVH